jgi:hypothetical protein
MTIVRLRRSPSPGPILVTLEVDSSVYLYSADIDPDPRARICRLSRSKTENSATWTDQISFDQADQEVKILVHWVAVDSVNPGRPYKATLAVLDSSGALAPARPGFANPLDVSSRIGPASDPTDMGRVSIIIS